MSIIKESDIPQVTPVVVRTKAEVMQVIKNNLDNFKLFGVSEIGLFGSFVREEATDQSKEYPVKFQHVAIAEVKDIIGASDRALELNTNSENITCSEYVAKIVALSVSKSTEKQSNNLDRD